MLRYNNSFLLLYILLTPPITFCMQEEQKALEIAVQNNNLPKAIALIKTKIDPNFHNPQRYSPLEIAARNGNPEITKLLIENRANTNNYTMVETAIQHANEEHMERYVKTIEHLISAIPYINHSALTMAINKRYKKISHLLLMLPRKKLKFFSIIHAPLHNDDCPIYAAVKTGQKDIFEKLLTRTIITEGKKYDLLVTAAEHGYTELVVQLLTLKANPYWPDTYSMPETAKKSALYMAALKNNHTTITTLLANLYALNSKYTTEKEALDSKYQEQIKIITDAHETQVQDLLSIHH